MNETIILSRDVEGTQIPAGTTITLPSGTEVSISQKLGGTFTVVSTFGMTRIDGKDADALGMDAEQDKPNTHDDLPPGTPPDEEAIWEAMKSCYDPEIPVNIVDLGLVYSCDLKEGEGGRFLADIQMTLTAPGCGMGPVIAEDVKRKVETIPGVGEANVEIVWDPPWTQDMISEEGKMQLGLI